MPGVDAATGVDTTVFSAILKEFYIGPIRDNLNSKTVMLYRLARNEDISYWTRSPSSTTG